LRTGRLSLSSTGEKPWNKIIWRPSELFISVLIQLMRLASKMYWRKSFWGSIYQIKSFRRVWTSISMTKRRRFRSDLQCQQRPLTTVKALLRVRTSLPRR
jgi:hypothetical protein